MLLGSTVGVPDEAGEQLQDLRDTAVQPVRAEDSSMTFWRRASVKRWNGGSAAVFRGRSHEAASTARTTTNLTKQSSVTSGHVRRIPTPLRRRRASIRGRSSWSLHHDEVTVDVVR